MAEICKLLAKVKSGVLQQVSVVKNAKRPARPMTAVTEFGWFRHMYHVKKEEDVLLHYPRHLPAGWYHFMGIFADLWKSEELRAHIIFPLGFLKGKKGGLKGILFPKLSDEWRIGLPEDDDQHKAYCAELVRVVKVLHYQAKVVHMDLLPCNIAWRVERGHMTVRLFDFDAALPLGAKIGETLLSLLNSDTEEFRWSGFAEAAVADVRMDLWYCHGFTLVTERVSCPISDPNGPVKVNSAFNESVRNDVVARGSKFSAWMEEQGLEVGT